MKISRTRFYLQSYFCMLLFLLVLGGYPQYQNFTSIAALSINLFILIMIYKSGSKFTLSTNFLLFIVFIICFAVSIIWSVDRVKSIEYFAMYIAGYSLLMVFENLNLSKKYLASLFEKLSILVWIYFGSKFLINEFMGQKIMMSFSLIGYSNIDFNHHHVGDLSAVVTFLSFLKVMDNKSKGKNFFLLLLIIGLIILFFSGSRSALISLIVGLSYIGFRLKHSLFNRTDYIVFLTTVILIFFFVGSSRSILFSRPYFLAAFESVFKYPFGVGVGNFGYFYKLLHSSYYTTVVHNIFLEFLVGMGILGFTFILWTTVV